MGARPGEGERHFRHPSSTVERHLEELLPCLAGVARRLSGLGPPARLVEPDGEPDLAGARIREAPDEGLARQPGLRADESAAHPVGADAVDARRLVVGDGGQRAVSDTLLAAGPPRLTQAFEQQDQAAQPALYALVDAEG